MPLLRRPAAVDPAAQARVRAVLDGAPTGSRGWVPTGPPVAGDRSPGATGLPVLVDAARPEELESLDKPDPAATPPGAAATPPGAGATPSGAAALDHWRRGRIDPGRRGVAALALVALLAAVLAGTVVLRGRPQEVSAPAVLAAGVPVPGSSAAASATAAPTGDVVVSVGGKVSAPGLVRLPAGSRVDDAVRAAGGALPGVDVGLLNLARRLVDGEQVLVGVPQPSVAAPGAASSGDGLVDLNTATVTQLDELPGVGPVLAQRIVDFRTENGPFGSVDQLREVSGIGESKFAQLQAKVRV